MGSMTSGRLGQACLASTVRQDRRWPGSDRPAPVKHPLTKIQVLAVGSGEEPVCHASCQLYDRHSADSASAPCNRVGRRDGNQVGPGHPADDRRWKRRRITATGNQRRVGSAWPDVTRRE